MSVGAGLYMYVVVVQKFTFAISSPDEFLSTKLSMSSASRVFVPDILTTGPGFRPRCMQWQIRGRGSSGSDEPFVAHHINVYNSSAVAEMGDRDHNRHGPRRGELLCTFAWGVGHRQTQYGLDRGILPVPSDVFIHPACSRLATIDMGRKLGSVPLYGGSCVLI